MNIPFDIVEIRQTLAVAICVSPIALLTGPVSGYLNQTSLLDLFQAWRLLPVFIRLTYLSFYRY